MLHRENKTNLVFQVKKLTWGFRCHYNTLNTDSSFIRKNLVFQSAYHISERLARIINKAPEKRKTKTISKHQSWASECWLQLLLNWENKTNSGFSSSTKRQKVNGQDSGATVICPILTPLSLEETQFPNLYVPIHQWAFSSKYQRSSGKTKNENKFTILNHQNRAL